MDLGEKMTALENQIYDTVVAMLKQAEIPSTVGRVIMDGVYRRFVESAYYVALQRGCDIDKPKNLAKSVTVE